MISLKKKYLTNIDDKIIYIFNMTFAPFFGLTGQKD